MTEPWYGKLFRITKKIIEDSAPPKEFVNEQQCHLPLKPENRTPPCPWGKASGRTSWMIPQILEQVSGGNSCVVICHNHRFAVEFCGSVYQYAKDKFPYAYHLGRSRDIILYKDDVKDPYTNIYFISESEYHLFMCGRRGLCEFWDHFAVGEQ